jgi:hypothetical protein
MTNIKIEDIKNGAEYECTRVEMYIFYPILAVHII